MNDDKKCPLHTEKQNDNDNKNSECKLDHKECDNSEKPVCNKDKKHSCSLSKEE